MNAPAMNMIGVILGKRGSGKTDYLKGNPKHNLPGIIPTYLKKDMKVLIVDTIDHPSYRDIKVIPLDKIPYWKKGVYRIFVPRQDIAALNKFLKDQPSMWNSLIVYEDAYKHTSVRIDKSLVELMGDSKQKNIDIIFMYWSWAQAPGDLYRMLDIIELFKTKDSPDVRKDYILDYYDEAIAAWNKVRNHPSQFYHTLIDTGL
jgi:hypothetical protein